MGEWRVHRSISEFEAAEWDGLVRESTFGTVFHSHGWLTAYESAPPELVHASYVIAYYDNGRMVACCPAYVVERDPHLVGYGPEFGIVHPLLSARMLVAHSWYAFYNTVCGPLEPTPELAHGLIEILRQLAQADGAPIFGFPGMHLADPWCGALCTAGLAGVLTEAPSSAAAGATVEEFLAPLRSHPRRGFRRLARKHQSMQARIAHGFRPGDEEQFANLINLVCAGHDSPPLYGRRTIEAMHRFLPDSCHFVSLRRDDQLLGATLSLEFNGVLYGWIAGLDYETHQYYGTYQALLWETLQLASDLGVERIEMGRGMYAAKARLGFTPQPVIALLAASHEHSVRFVAEGLAALDQGCRTVDRVRQAFDHQGGPLPAAWDAATVARTAAMVGSGERGGAAE